MNDLYSYFLQGRTARPVHKWHHYFEVYERHLHRFRHASPVLLEIGVELGGSLEMWRDWLGPGARIFGLDINPTAKRHEDIATRIFIGDQKDRATLRAVLREVGPLDIVIDDGGHTAEQQIVSFEELYGAVVETGVYIVEDTHTALWGGMFSDRVDGRSFPGFAFERAMQMMEWTGRRENFATLGGDPTAPPPPEVSAFCRGTQAVSFYDSMIVFERARRPVPRHERRGARVQEAPTAAAATPAPIPAMMAPELPAGMQPGLTRPLVLPAVQMREALRPGGTGTAPIGVVADAGDGRDR